MSSLFGSQTPPLVGQQLGTFIAGAGDYGQSIPYVFGCIFVPEFRLWQQQVATTRTVSVGGKGGLFGGGGTDQTLYNGSFLSGFCRGPIPMFGTQVAIRRILLDAKIVVDFSELKTWLPIPETPDQENDRLNASRTYLQNVTMYNGATSGQIPDPSTAAAIGGNTPGYQGIVTAGFEGIDWPNGRPPGINVEICQAATHVGTDQIVRQSCALSTIITTLLVDAGIAPYDVDTSALLTQQVRGLIVPADQKEDKINDLMRYFNVDCVQSGHTLTFFPIDRPVSINIPFSNLATSAKDSDGNPLDPLEITEVKGTDLPYSIEITCKNYDNDYNKLTELYSAPSGEGQASIRYDLSDFAATSTELIQASQMQYWRARTERFKYKFSLPSWYGNLDPGDVVNITDDDNVVETVRLTKVDVGGSDFLVACEAVRHSVYTSTLTGASVSGGVTLTFAGSTTWKFMNLPPLTDAHASNPGVYIAACGTTNGWVNGSLYRSKDSGAEWVNVLTLPSSSTIGSVNAASGIYSSSLPNSSTYFLDTSSKIAVTLVDITKTLSNVTLAQGLSGQNVFLIGSEIVIALNCTLISTGVYGLSNFIRGRRATERFTSTHVPSEDVVLLSGSGINFLDCNYSDIGRPDLWKLVPNGQTLADVTQQTHTITGENMIPFNPVNFVSSVAIVSGAPDVTWTVNRRSRIGQVLTPVTNIPLGETSEQYYWSLYNPSNILIFSYTTSVSTFNWSHTQRNTYLGSPTADMTGYYLRCAQISSTMGNGYAAEYTFTGAYA